MAISVKTVLKMTPVHDFDSFSIIFYCNISTAYQKIEDTGSQKTQKLFRQAYDHFRFCKAGKKRLLLPNTKNALNCL